MKGNQTHNTIVKIDFLGDISLADWEIDICNVLDIAKKINTCLEEVDYRIANFESPVVLNEEAKPIDKFGPNLKTDKRYLSFFEEMHIDGYALANNHLGDYGVLGIEDTLKVLENLGKDYIGTSFEPEKLYKPLRKEINGIRMSFFSVCENEFGIGHEGQIGAAGYNKELMQALIKDEAAWADYQVIIFHGGTEYNPFPSPGQKLRYRELIDFGVDAVIGMHTHCPQGYEIYKDRVIVYSMGNFFFPEVCETPFETWKVGYITRLYFTSKGIDIDFIPYKFDIYGRDFSLMDKSVFTEYLEEISGVIQDVERLENLYKAWACMSGKMYFERMCKSIQDLGNRKELSVVKNMFSCEAHNELMRTYLNLLYNNEIEKYKKYEKEIKRYMQFPGENTAGQEVNEKDSSEVNTVIWGIGRKAELLYRKMCSKGKVIVFADKSCLKQGLLFCGKQIVSPEDVIRNYKKAEIYICTSEKSALEVQEFLKENNITWNRSED